MFAVAAVLSCSKIDNDATPYQKVTLGTKAAEVNLTRNRTTESFEWKRYVNNNSHDVRINLDTNSQIAIFDAK